MALIIATSASSIILIVSMLTLLCCSLLYGGISKWCDKVANILARLSIVGMIVSVFALAVIAILTIIGMAKLVVK